MEKAVEIYDDVPRSGTFIISKGFKRDHHRLMELIKKHKERFLRLGNNSVSTGLIMRRIPVKKAGRPVNEIMLNEQQTIFLGTLFRNTEVVLDFKERLAKEFVEQRNWMSNAIQQRENPDWQNVRRDGKLVYRQKTDIVKHFVDYATEQGSKHAQMYYSNLANMENSALFYLEQKYKNLREVLTIKQLMQVSTADDVIEKALQEGMDQGLHYRDCYKLAKKRIITFAEIIGKSPVLSLELK
jgi:phage regulator Rha-like protein